MAWGSNIKYLENFLLFGQTRAAQAQDLNVLKAISRDEYENWDHKS
jgi:hypothetical protein